MSNRLYFEQLVVKFLMQTIAWEDRVDMAMELYGMDFTEACEEAGPPPSYPQDIEILFNTDINRGKALEILTYLGALDGAGVKDEW